MQFNVSQPGLALAGVKVSINQIRLNINALGDSWHQTLEEILTRLGR
jgi:hypothetical protein